MCFTMLFVSSFLLGQAIEKAETSATEGINWMSWDEAVVANKKQPKKIFVDLYTDWCGWCKKMDKTTFMDEDIVKEMNDNFYAVKFDAEQKEVITFNESEFKYVNAGRRGVHQLAYALVDGKMSYPSFVMLDENFDRITKLAGYKQPQALEKELKYLSSDSYKTMDIGNFKPE